MKCPDYISNTPMQEDASAHCSGRGALHGDARVMTLVTLKTVLLCFTRVMKMMKCYSSILPKEQGGSGLDPVPQKRSGGEFWVLRTNRRKVLRFACPWFFCQDVAT